MERGGFTFVNWRKKIEPRSRRQPRLGFLFFFLFLLFLSVLARVDTGYRGINVSSRGESVLRDSESFGFFFSTVPV